MLFLSQFHAMCILHRILRYDRHLRAGLRAPRRARDRAKFAQDGRLGVVLGVSWGRFFVRGSSWAHEKAIFRKRPSRYFNISARGCKVVMRGPTMASGGADRIVKYEVKYTSPEHDPKMISCGTLELS